MSIGAALLVFALGAILSFAVRTSPDGLDLNVVGIVLMIVGAVGVYLRTIGYAPDHSVVTLPSWMKLRREGPTEVLYDPMAEDATVYRTENGGPEVRPVEEVVVVRPPHDETRIETRRVPPDRV